ncbi:MAG: hypothetical protein K1X67_23135 [Fimbriimonadaceae bacterium]|nr:hypothetical protein [Fimbriimonadaceae bacterium]
MHLITTCLLLFSSSFSQAVQKQVPPVRYWALVHACDEVARAKVMGQKTVSEAIRVAETLGYEAVLDENIYYLYPIPAWSLDANTALLDLFADKGLNSGRPRPISELPKHQADHLQGMLEHNQVGGGLGELMRATKAGKVNLVKSVDVKINLAGKDYVVPFKDQRLTRLFFVSPREAQAQVRDNRSYPTRQALFGLMKSNFAVSPSFTTSPKSFNHVVNRATQLLREKQDASRKKLLEQLDITSASGVSELIRQLQGGAGVPYSSLPRDVQLALGEALAMSPETFGLPGGVVPDHALSSAVISVPSEGVRVILEFLLDGTLSASDGSPVKYRVGWELKDLASGGS